MIVSCNKDGIAKTYNIIKKGGIVIFPTDTVYGLGCDPYNHLAVKKIYKIKGRDEAKRLPVLGYSLEEISKIVYFNNVSRKIADKFWPGPVTLILPVKDEKIVESLELEGKIAVRVPNNPCILALLKECKLLVGTSANLSGQLPFSDSKEIPSILKEFDILLDGGKIANSTESSIVEVTSSGITVIREGKISRKELLSLI